MNTPQTPTPPEPVWLPDQSSVAGSRIAGFTEFVARLTGVTHPDYESLWAWSVADLPGFWTAVSEFFAIRTSGAWSQVLDDAPMPATRWFSGARLNYAEHALRTDDPTGTAIISVDESGATTHTTWAELRGQVGALSAWLRRQGVTAGDRVVGYLPNSPHTVVAFLASASIGAVWSACGQDYGSDGAATRFAQLEPVVLFAADGYRWSGRRHDRRAETAALRTALPSVRVTVQVPNLGLPLSPDAGTGTVLWEDTLADPAECVFDHVPFDTPLWVLFSSGTTGTPKGIVHGHGGVLLDHHKLLGLHLDLGPGDRFLWYTTTNWMMWNLVVSGLLVGATIVLYDGSPAHPAPGRLWALAAEHRATVLGVSPGYLQSSAKAGLTPGRDLDLSALRVLGSTGAPLPAQSYYWVRDHVGPRVQVASTSGGTDIVSGFAGSAPNTAVWPGEISAPLLGVALEAFDSRGRPVTEEVGELVVTRPMPSMPLRFWNDPDGRRYHEAYFSSYPGVWQHGDWITRTAHGSVIISGRSDSTLNRHGVRLGSADIYAVVDELPGVRESLVIGAELPDGDYWMPLFVVLEPGHELDEELRDTIRTAIRTHASPRHVPDVIIEVPAVPHTRTGKKLEVPVKRLLQGAAIGQVAGREAVDDITALEYFTQFTRSPAPAPLLP
ncbi:acetoacetate--CoA ligase [Streptomyces beijiangensis]|uniref:Acetoacetate--CoA ligase n=1 Tax=Streptomyces beijiangensis TaxID=163361 RepID=A0A939F742_9ACTN|nr:acetoacetate--CoA ligase [Streptomyces beijiangensis]MBO0513056.1 acetoacetate--CoA ligase [Streptomyces beijiangensis]